MADRDAVAADDDLLDEQPGDALALGHIQSQRPVAKACEELVQRVRQPQVRGLIGQLRGEGLLLGLQARLALAQLEHAPPQLVQAEQTLLVGREQSLDASLRLQQLALDPILMALGRIASACSLDAACKLGLDQRRGFEQARHLVPHRLFQQARFAKNPALINTVALAQEALIEQHRNVGGKQRWIGEFNYEARSWDRPRRVIARLEHDERGANPRFVVTSLEGDAQELYEQLYWARGEAENRIKEAQIDLFGRRASCHRYAANQLRLLLAALA